MGVSIMFCFIINILSPCKAKVETNIKGILHFFLEIGSFYHSPRVKQLSFSIILIV